MKNSKVLVVALFMLFCGMQVKSQDHWIGSNNTISEIYRYGNVGIGTDLPWGKLHISNSESGMPTFYLQHESNTPWGFAMLIKVDNDNVKAFNIQTTDGADLFRIMGNGVVNAMKIYAEEIEVRIDAMTIHWPDYVFANSYKLRSLQEVELYINENGHLPEIPSALEVEESGINLGEMDAVLLKKIEELTLYIIQQEKRIAELEYKVNNN